MPRSMVGLLAAVGTAMSALVAFTHGDLIWVTIADAAVANGLVALLTFGAPTKKTLPRRV
jgi:tetrahydromethanopterin S-methyltransferase subunit C